MSTRPHILVAEDEMLAALAIEQYLTFKGCRVTTARDGLEALERQNADPADALVTDLRMPRLDGASLIRQIRQTRSDLPVIVMTGYLEENDIPGPLQEGEEVSLIVLKKPVSPQEIWFSLTRLLPG